MTRPTIKLNYPDKPPGIATFGFVFMKNERILHAVYDGIRWCTHNNEAEIIIHNQIKGWLPE